MVAAPSIILHSSPSNHRSLWFLQSSHRLAAAGVGRRANALSLADLHGGFRVGGGSAHALLDLAGHGQESLFDVAGVLCGGLEERNAEAVSEFLLYC